MGNIDQTSQKVYIEYTRLAVHMGVLYLSLNN